MTKITAPQKNKNGASFRRNTRPKWGKRILENLKVAGFAIGLGALALSGCAKAQIKAVTPAYPRNTICDPKLGTFYIRPDGMDSILSNPTDCGQNYACTPTFPFMALALFYENEAKNP